MVYAHPTDPKNTSVRVMPGRPHAEWPSQRNPYVIRLKNGKHLDKFGNEVALETAEAHIPLEEFVYAE